MTIDFKTNVEMWKCENVKIKKLSLIKYGNVISLRMKPQ